MNTAAVLLLSAALADVPLWQHAPTIEARGDVLRYEGFLNPSGADFTVDLLRGGRFKVLEVDSAGGELHSSLRIAREVHRHRIEVVVKGLCLSACANYLFPAAARKRIEPGGIVAWHGDARQPNTLLRIELLKEWEQSLGRSAVSASDRKWLADVRDNIRAQDAFYAEIGVRDGFARLGHENLPVVQGFWALPVADMQVFGMERIAAPADYGSVDYCDRVKAMHKLPSLACLDLGTERMQHWLHMLKTAPRVSP